MDDKKSRNEVYITVTKLFKNKTNFNTVELSFVVREQGFYCIDKWVKEAAKECIKKFGYGIIWGDDVIFNTEEHNNESETSN
jgi:hypothetical protein